MRNVVAVEKRFLSPREAAAHLGLQESTLERWRIIGRGPRFRKFGAAVRYGVEDLELWIQSVPVGGARPAAR